MKIDTPDISLSKTQKNLVTQNQELRARLEEAEETLRAIRSGEVDALIVSGADGEKIFTLRQAQAQIRYQAVMLESVNDAIIASDAHYRLTGWNAAAESLYGWKADEVLGRDSKEVIRTEWPDAGAEDMKDAVKEMGRWRGEATQQRKDGTRFPVEVSWMVLRDEGGEVMGHVSVNRDITERKRAERDLQESEKGLNDAQSLGRLGSWSFDVETQTISWSDQLYRLYERDPQLGVPSLEDEAAYYTPEQSKLLKEYAARAISAGESFAYDLEVQLPLGKHLSFSAKMQPIKDGSGRVAKLFGTIHDITERKHAEQALQESEIKFRTLVEHLPGAVYINAVGSAGTTIYVSSQIQTLLGYTAQEWLADPKLWSQTLHPEDRELVLRQTSVTNQSHESFDMEYRRLHGDGRVVWVRDQCIVVRDSKGEPQFWQGIMLDITWRKHAEEDLRQRLAELEAMHTVSAALRTAQTRDKALPILLDETLAALEIDAGIIWLYDPKSDELRAAVARGVLRSLSEIPIRPGDGVAGEVFISGQTFATEHEQIPSGWGSACVPIHSGSVIIGVLFISVESPRQITSQQIRLLESLAQMAGTALERMRLYEETMSQLARLQALRAIDLTISSSFDLRTTLSVILEQAAAQLQVDAAAVLLFNPYAHILEYAAERGFRNKAIRKAHVNLGEGYAGRVALELQLIQIPNLKDAPNPSSLTTLLKGEDFVCYYGVPLMAKGEVKGVLEVFHRAVFEPDADWLDFLNALAGQAAIAIENATLFESLQRSNSELSQAYDATIEGWSRALDLRDKETEGHTQRVAEMTVKLARAFDLSETELVQVRWGALLHDIGKMGIPDGILLKPGSLSDEEWVLMKKHPTFAYEMLSPIRYLRLALDLPYCHHEKWDGTGYPRALKGDQIPLVARIFAVVDVWDALRSDRPYRAAWDEKKVHEHIRASSGTHFDPQVVDRFMHVLQKDSFLQIIERTSDAL